MHVSECIYTEYKVKVRISACVFFDLVVTTFQHLFGIRMHHRCHGEQNLVRGIITLALASSLFTSIHCVYIGTLAADVSNKATLPILTSCSLAAHSVRAWQIRFGKASLAFAKRKEYPSRQSVHASSSAGPLCTVVWRWAVEASYGVVWGR
jgi:hypothetical protein